MSREVRPADDHYYETRLELFSQGDIFYDVPLAYPLPADEIVEDSEEFGYGSRRFLSGPLDVGHAMLITPTCSMRAQGTPNKYAHPVRTLVPLKSFSELVDTSLIDSAKAGLARKYDSLINYMYVPTSDRLEIPESLALLYMPITLHHKMIEGQRITQLAWAGAQQLQRKLMWFTVGLLDTRDVFDPPMD